MSGVQEPLPVGPLLALEVEARGWSQAEFATVLGRPVQFVSEILNGKKEITRESAAQIGAALGQTPEYWLRLQDQHLLRAQATSQETQRQLSDVRRRARLNQLVPVSALQKRGVLQGETLTELEAEVADLLELRKINEEPRFQIAARRSDREAPVSHAQLAWVGCVRRAVRNRVQRYSYSRERLTTLAAELPVALSNPEAWGHLPARLAATGVNLVYVRALPGAKIDGCAFTLEGRPVIALSGRGKRLDKVLWTLLHEIAHVVLGHVSSAVAVEALDQVDGSDELENAADQRAIGWLLPEPLPTLPPRVTAEWVQAVAVERRLATIVVVGQLQKTRAVDWRSSLARGAPDVTRAMAGW